MNNKDIQLSKALSWLLRHGAKHEGLPISSEGYIEVDIVLQQKSFKGKYNKSDIERVVLNNNKQRFKLILNPTTNRQEIKANQGHTICDITEKELTPILESNKYPIVVHGTYLKFWPQIKELGLNRMKRQHIHLAKGTLQDKTVISGLRPNIDIYIFIDLKKALCDNLKFFESENGVILTKGNAKGFLEPKYFMRVIKVDNGDY